MLVNMWPSPLTMLCFSNELGSFILPKKIRQQK